MSVNRLTARFSDDEMRKIEAHAVALGVTKTEVLRYGVGALSSSERTAAQMAEMREMLMDDMRAELAARMSRISDQNRKTATLLLLVLKAPEEAKAALNDIFKD